MSEPECILAIDLGSSGPKVSLVTADGRALAVASGRVATNTTADGGSEQDPEAYWRSVTDCVRQVVASAGLPVERILAISCASQWSVTVAVDEQCRPLMPAIHWSDRRGAPYSQRITDGLIKVAGYGLRRMIQWVRLTGGVPTHAGSDALAHILFIKHERPDIYRATYKLLEPMDFLNFRLCGRAVATYATVYPYLLTDNRDSGQIEYAQSLIDLCGLDRAKLPDLVPQGTVLGTLLPAAATEWGLSPETKVIAGTPDSQGAALGSGAVADFSPHICLGTTAWMSCHVPFKKTNLFSYLATMPSAMCGRNMVMAEQGPAGKCLQVFVENWLYPASAGQTVPTNVYEQVDALARTVPAGSDGLLFLPWLNGAGPPSGEGTIRGGFLNQSLIHGRAHALRAVMEGVAFNLCWLRIHVERFVNRKFDGFNFIGGCARSDLWSQILADSMGLPIRRMVQPEMAISRGAAMVAWAALGRIGPQDFQAMVHTDRTFLPDPVNQARYTELFAEFLNSYKANRGIFRRLNTT